MRCGKQTPVVTQRGFLMFIYTTHNHSKEENSQHKKLLAPTKRMQIPKAPTKTDSFYPIAFAICRMLSATLALFCFRLTFVANGTMNLLHRWSTFCCSVK